MAYKSQHQEMKPITMIGQSGKINSMKQSFDWHSEKLTPQTVITERYKNTQNVRRFFKQQIGEHFSFNRKFMAFIKNNVGITLSQATDEWKANHHHPKE